VKLKDIADSFELQTIGNVDKEISGLASLEKAGPDDLAFLFSRSHRESLVSSEAGAFVLKKEDKDLIDGPAIISPNPRA
jgi:UDP-3-O-[3-hydroxymyristoyl] glucosamine N-acyltransferase